MKSLSPAKLVGIFTLFLLALPISNPLLAQKYQLLSDEKASAIKDYRVVDGVLGIAKPATFIVDQEGVIRWKYVGSDISDRVFSETITEKLKIINGNSSKPWDVNSDGRVDIFDLVLVAKSLGTAFFQNNSPDNPDVNRDGNVDILDLVLVANHFGETLN